MPDINKFDSQTKSLLANDEEAHALDSTSPVSLVLRGTEDFNAEQLETLRELGITIRTVAGDVLTADALITSLPDVSDLDFVSSLQVSQPLFYDEGDQPLDFLADAE